MLTYNRNHLLEALLNDLQSFSKNGVQVIVVDNCSETPASEVTARLPWVENIRAPRNLGAAGRNLGFSAARGDFVICLDDDVAELSKDAAIQLGEIFQDPTIAAVNFKVMDQQTRCVVNWVHHRQVEEYAEMPFDTYEITEGAVAFRRSALDVVGGYPEEFFLSHEGPDLAFRLINSGHRVVYHPGITVTHSFDPAGRLSWRNYYFDTRNTLWLVVRNLPIIYGAATLIRQNGAMLVYAIRDGYVRWWCKGMVDAIIGLRAAFRQRNPLSREAMKRVREMDSFRPSIIYTLKRRLFSREMKL